MRILIFTAFLALALCQIAPAQSVSISFTAGVIRGSNGLAVDVNSIGLLVADTSRNGFGTNFDLPGSVLSSNHTLGGSDNIILQTFSAADLEGGLIGFNGNVHYTDTTLVSPGTPLALFWFPTIKSVGATVPTASSVPYGFYRTDAIDFNSGSDIGFTAPPVGYNVALAVFDKSTFAGTLASAADLTASHATGITPVPELSSAIQGSLAFLAIAFHLFIRHFCCRKPVRAR